MTDLLLEHEELCRALSVFIVEKIEQATKPLRERISELEKCIAELETRGLNYCGVYQRAAMYRRGDVCSHNGSMFVAVDAVAPNQPPGNGGVWVLSVKGADEHLRQPTRPASRIG